MRWMCVSIRDLEIRNWEYAEKGTHRMTQNVLHLVKQLDINISVTVFYTAATHLLVLGSKSKVSGLRVFVFGCISGESVKNTLIHDFIMPWKLAVDLSTILIHSPFIFAVQGRNCYGHDWTCHQQRRSISIKPYKKVSCIPHFILQRNLFKGSPDLYH